MPVFGKRNAPQRPQRLITPRKPLGTRIVRQDGQKKYEEAVPWKKLNSTLRETSNELRLDIKTWTRQRFLQTREPVVALEWGCGLGRAITSLSFCRHVTAIGYGADSYTQWQNNQRVRFIQETPDRLLRYLKDNSMDIIFSRLGLEYLEEDLNNPDQYADYLKKLGKKLKPGGIIVTTLQGFTRQVEWEKRIDRRVDGLNVQVHQGILTLTRL